MFWAVGLTLFSSVDADQSRNLYLDYVNRGNGYSSSSSYYYSSGCGGHTLSKNSSRYPYVGSDLNPFVKASIEASNGYVLKTFLVSKVKLEAEIPKLIEIYRLVSQIEYFNLKGSLSGIKSKPDINGDFDWFPRKTFTERLLGGKNWKILYYDCDKCTKCNGSRIDLFKNFGRGVECDKCQDGKAPYHLLVRW